MADLVVYSTVSDGYIDSGFQATWVLAHDPADGVNIVTAPLPTGTQNRVAGYNVARTFLFFDTSALGALVTITGVKLSLFCDEKLESNVGHSNLHIVEGIQNDPLQLSDFGAHLSKITSGGSIVFASIVEGAYNDIVLNATGRGWINKTGITKLCLRVLGDINNLAPPNIGDKNIVTHHPSESGVGFWPILTITYVSVPVVTTDPASALAADHATLNGTLDNDGGEACDCGFESGETEAYEHGPTPTQSKVTSQTFSQLITGLAPNTTYHFRAFATNSAGTGYGADRSFTTASIPSRAHALSREEL